MSSEQGQIPEKEAETDSVQPSRNINKNVRQSFRRSSTADTPSTSEDEAKSSYPNQTEFYVTELPPEEVAPYNDGLSDLSSNEKIPPNGFTNVTPPDGKAGWQESLTFKGRRPGDRYIRFSKAQAAQVIQEHFDRDRLLFSNTLPAEPMTPFGRKYMQLKRLLIGRPLPSSEAIHQRLSKVSALAVLSSDALSSTAYGTEQILLVLAAAQGAQMGLVIPISLFIGFLIIIVGLSYRQTIHAYPLGGGSYIVAKDNLGVTPGLIAAASLMIDYILTVAVSITAGVAAITSALPATQQFTVEMCIVFLVLIAVANLRGVRESGAIFTAPTYIFIFSIIVMMIFGFLDWAGVIIFTPVIREITPIQQAESLSLFLILRAFASGCSAMTGVEAVSDGVPAFKKPESKNASTTLVWMCTILVSLFIGISLLANHFGVQPMEGTSPGYETVVSQIAHHSVGDSPLYFIIQAATAMILVLAANTAFSDFPRLSWFLARDKFLPHLFSHKGERLAFSTGILTLTFLAGILIVIFGGQTDALIPLYAVGVFNSFTLSQSGMVLRWWRLRTPGWGRSIAFNALGALLTFVVLIIIAATKFLSGAWVVVMLIPMLYLVFKGINKHYERFENQVAKGDTEDGPLAITNNVVFVPVNDLNPITRRTLSYARSLSDDVTAIHVNDDPEKIEGLRKKWDESNLDIPLVVVETPFRAIIGPLLTYIDTIHKREPNDIITVIVPEFITAKWWQRLLHNQTAFRLRASLFLRPGIVIVSVPYHLRT